MFVVVGAMEGRGDFVDVSTKNARWIRGKRRIDGFVGGILHVGDDSMKEVLPGGSMSERTMEDGMIDWR